MSEHPGAVPGASILLVGQFNPLILQPEWLFREDVIDEEDYAALLESENVIVSAEYSAADCRRFGIEVFRDRFALESRPETETPDQIYEALSSIFTRLSHTPIRGFGISFFWHLPAVADEWTRLQNRLVPPDNWEEMLRSSTLSSLSMRGGRDDGRSGEILITVEPSKLEGHTCFVQVSDQVDLEDAKVARSALDELEDVWSGAEMRACERFEAIARLLR